jgi:2-succinyl-6-hydroxy-2,4-cyclohexadiene-1-carboxylate synthase
MKALALLLHGFTGAPGSYAAVRAELGDHVSVLCPALAGHAGVALDHATTFDDEVTRLLGLLGDARDVTLCGYSLGARFGLGLLVRAPERFRRAILIGVHPGLADPAERQKRREGDARWAAVLRDQGLAAFIDRWQAQPLFASQGKLLGEQLATQRALRMSHDPEGLARSLERFGLGEMPCYWPALPSLPTPTTLAAGQRDAMFIKLAEQAARELPHGRLLMAPDAGHNLPLERPELVARAIASELTP